MRQWRIFPRSGQYAHSVTCIDLDDSRLLPSVRDAENIVFLLMDAINLQMASGSVDVIVFYNALAHVENELEKILNECYSIEFYGKERSYILSALLELIKSL